MPRVTCHTADFSWTFLYVDPISGGFSSKGKNNPHRHRKTFIHSLIIFSMQKNGIVTTLQPEAQQNRPVVEQVGWIAL